MCGRLVNLEAVHARDIPLLVALGYKVVVGVKEEVRKSGAPTENRKRKQVRKGVNEIVRRLDSIIGLNYAGANI